TMFVAGQGEPPPRSSEPPPRSGPPPRGRDRDEEDDRDRDRDRDRVRDRPRDDYDDRPSRRSRSRDEDYDDRPSLRRGGRGADHRGAMILMFGIISMVGFLVFPLLSIIFGPMAWFMGSADLKEMQAGRMDREGEGQTRTGQILGII